MDEINKLFKKIDKDTKKYENLQRIISIDLKELASKFGIESFSMITEQHYEKGHTYENLKIESIQTTDCTELLDLHLDYGDLQQEFGMAFEEVLELKVPNSVDFISGKKYPDSDDSEVVNINFGKLALHFLKQDVDHEVAGKFLSLLFGNRSCVPDEWFKKYD